MGFNFKNMDKKTKFVYIFSAIMIPFVLITFFLGEQRLTLVGLVIYVGTPLALMKIFKPKGGRGSYAPRRGWDENEKERVRNRQNGRCNKCHKVPPRWEYHHRDGNRSNNSLSNCEGLCPNCHSVKTHDE